MLLYDSLSQGKREFVPRDGDHVTMYFCGPTVYNYIHLGNARPYVVSMVAKRYFEHLGYKVTLVENVTDIDDRIIEIAKKEGRTAREVADRFIQAYREDTDALGLGRPNIEPLATEHIQEIIDLIDKLVENGRAYSAGGDVYFDVDSFPEYGRLSKQKVGEMRSGTRIAPEEVKEDPLDFVLWKGAKPGEPSWASPWGPGRPGWHIECSAMSLKYLGEGFDIHGGGRDLIFPHHENEVAQAEGALGSPFVRFWVHNGMLNISDEKMSKSVGNIFLLRRALEHYRPEALIAYFMGSHYRNPMDFSKELLDEAVQRVERLRNFFRAADEYAAGREGTGGGGSGNADTGADRGLAETVTTRKQAYEAAMNDDLNTAGALGEVFGLARDINARLAVGDVSPEAVREARSQAAEMIYTLGLEAVTSWEQKVPEDVLEMAEKRRECRQSRDFQEADLLRDAILERGYEVRDAADGIRILPRE